MKDYSSIDKELAVKIEEESKKLRNEVADMYVKCRKSHKITQGKMADMVGVKRPNITRFETGNYNPTIEMMVKIAACMGMKVEIKLVEDEEAR